MKRAMVVVLMVFIGTFVMATGQVQESTGPVEVGLWGQDVPIKGEALYYQDVLFKDWKHETVLKFYPPGDGSAMSVQLDVAAGTPPDLYLDYMGRVNNYANSQYAVDLSAAVPRGVLDLYDPSFLAMTTKGGTVWALPETAWVMPMVVNKSLMEQIGMFDVIADRSWTIEEFEEASRRVRQLEGDHYGFAFFAAGGSAGDYWNMALLPGFGASLYRDNRIVIGEPAGRRALQWYQDYINADLALPGAAGLLFSGMLEAWGQGRLLAISGTANRVGDGAAFFAAGTAPYAFEGWLTGFPLASGVDKAPLAVGPDAVMAFRKGSRPRTEVIETLVYMAGPRAQGLRVANQFRIPSLLEIERHDGEAWDAEYFQVSLDLLREHGAWDIGLGLTEYARVRVLVPEMFQAIYSGGSVDAAIAEFEKEAGAILGQ